jgi:hypothetical protein
VNNLKMRWHISSTQSISSHYVSNQNKSINLSYYWSELWDWQESHSPSMTCHYTDRIHPGKIKSPTVHDYCTWVSPHFKFAASIICLTVHETFGDWLQCFMRSFEFYQERRRQLVKIYLQSL